MPQLIILSFIILLSGCSSPPKPPVVDGTTRQVINNEEMIELMARPLTLKNRCQKKGEPLVKASPKSQTIRIYFAFNETDFQLSPAESKKLRSWISKAHRIEVRGRTDAQSPSTADEQIALKRALAVQHYLLEQGVSPALISINYLSAGDYRADNFSDRGRMQNRRVDIEIFK